MRRWAGLLVAAGLAASTGCRVFERWSKDRDRPLGEPASRTRDRDRDADRDPSRPPKHWLDNPALPGGKAAAVPPAGSYGDPRDPNYDLRTEVKGLLAGQVVDPDGRGVPYLDVQIELTDPGAGGGGAAVTAQTDRGGYFLIRGLKPNESYTLTARAKQGGLALAGQAVARTPSPYVRLQLRDDLALPPAKGPDLPPAAGPARPPAATPPAPATSIPGGPPTLFDAPAPRPGGPAPPPLPRPKDTGVLPYPTENAPGYDGAFSPVPPAPGRAPAAGPAIPLPKPPTAPRPDLTTNIPNPSPAPPAKEKESLLPPPTLAKYPAKNAAGAFSLTDPLGRPRAFPSGRADELVLLDFMTTTCLPCKKAVPALTALQAKYGAAGLEVIGVACDDVPEAARRELAAKYAEDHRLNYLVYAEPGAAPGAVMKRFGVTVFPTLVLVDGTGAVVWRGRPADLAGLERVLTEVRR